MDLQLCRTSAESDGIFGALIMDQDRLCTLEHAYADDAGNYLPKIPPGVYTCVRGMHQLDGMTEPFETFEITGVAGHSGLLFHWGNWNKDSSGCVLLGKAQAPSNQGMMVVKSREAFAEFMQMQSGVQSFLLTVSGP